MIARLLGLSPGATLRWWPVALAIAAQALAIWIITGQRNDLRDWQADVVQATRFAADHPKLATRAVPQQIRNLGTGMDRIRTAMAQAKANALAAKIKAEAADESRRKDADNEMAPTLGKALASTDAYARDQRLQCRIERTPAYRSGDARADLPGTTAPAPVIDRSGAGPAMVLIPRAALDACTTLKVRLDNAHGWAVGGER
ncbi:Sec-independent protein translocase protein TatA [Novosphingobium hassiacum]|uniref:Sec-independent protein translocase protein TatA n=1 Tax=Novosphingobium hassiacum TaxID=173676 RepID=A0A7W5ZSZ3_9SPHN|nr:hypothetical protein [Novosphingobium hassiacum]MBB3858896.1 Sec-independent protein translocase protein TatA [Novosphingobium hassiacum]